MVHFKGTFIFTKSALPFLLPSQRVVDIVTYVSPEQESSCLLSGTSKSLPALNDHLSECPVPRMGHPAIRENLKLLEQDTKVSFISFKAFLKIESICHY